MPVAERRRLGAAYLHAYVCRDDPAIEELAHRYDPITLLAALATASRAMVVHVADVEKTEPSVVTAAYRDVWS